MKLFIRVKRPEGEVVTFYGSAERIIPAYQDMLAAGLSVRLTTEDGADYTAEAATLRQIALQPTLRLVEKMHILDVLAANDGHLGRTAEALGICRMTLWRKLNLADASPVRRARLHSRDSEAKLVE